MAQQLPIQQQNYNLPPLQNPQIVNVAPQQPITGSQKPGIDWAGLLGNLGSYMAAAGSAYGTGANPSQGLLNAANAMQKHTQNIRQYDAMAPKYQAMGYDVSGYDPRRGGAGLTATPEKMIELESLIDQRRMNNEYRQQMIDSLKQKEENVQTVEDLMLFDPQFRAMMNKQYDFRNGANAKILKRPVSKEALQSLMPKNVNINYTGGLNSSKKVDVSNTYDGRGKEKKPKKAGTRLIVE